MISVARKHLTDAVGLVGNIIPKNNRYDPILNFLYLQATPTGMLLRGSNGETSLEIGLEAEVGFEYQALVPYLPFHAFLGGLGEGVVEIREVSGRLELRCGAAQASFTTTSVDGYPSPFESWVEPDLTLSNADLLFILGVTYASSTEEYRAVFCGVQLERGGGKLKAVASDSYRLAQAWVEHPDQEAGRCVIPRPAVATLQRLAAQAGERGALGWSAQQVFFRSGSCRLITRRLEGEFPDYSRAIPTSFIAELLVPREALMESMRRVAVMASRENRRVDVKLQADKVALSAEGDWGRSSEEISGEYHGDALAFSVNSSFLIDALKHLDTEVITLDFSAPQSPFVMRGERTSALIVPLRIQ